MDIKIERDDEKMSSHGQEGRRMVGSNPQTSIRIIWERDRYSSPPFQSPPPWAMRMALILQIALLLRHDDLLCSTSRRPYIL